MCSRDKDPGNANFPPVASTKCFTLKMYVDGDASTNGGTWKLIAIQRNSVLLQTDLAKSYRVVRLMCLLRYAPTA